MIKNYVTSIAFFATSLICLLLYNINGQYVDENGILHEAFAFIPLAWLFFFAAIISFAVIWFIRSKKKNKQ